MSEQRPLIVYVSGPLGSGKTTLANKILGGILHSSKEERMSDGIAVLLVYDELMKLEGKL